MAIGDDILAMMRACEEMPEYQRTDCPECGWHIDSVDGVLHCPFCGWVSR